MNKRLIDLREERDKSQKELAQYLKCTSATYSRYESGKRNIPNDVLKQLARFYNVSIDYILGETDDKTPHPKKGQGVSR